MKKGNLVQRIRLALLAGKKVASKFTAVFDNPRKNCSDWIGRAVNSESILVFQ